jgi:hypothetical protein
VRVRRLGKPSAFKACTNSHHSRVCLESHFIQGNVNALKQMEGYLFYFNFCGVQAKRMAKKLKLRKNKLWSSEYDVQA